MVLPIVAAAGGSTALDWFKAASPLLGGALGDAPPASNATSDAYQTSTFNNSGWTTATSGSKANGANTGYENYIMLGGLIFLAALYFKSKK